MNKLITDDLFNVNVKHIWYLWCVLKINIQLLDIYLQSIILIY